MLAGPDLATIRAAHERIRPYIHRTPVMTSRSLDELAGVRLFFKCENLQKTGSFKIRGAMNTVLSLSEAEARRGVVTHSSGNHATAVAYAARLRGIPAHVVMPSNAPLVKRQAVEAFGGKITLCEPTLAAREAAAQSIIEQTGAVLVHPYNDERIIAGQATAALELLEQVPELDAVIAPVSGGGLLSGTAIAVKSLRPQAEVIGAEPAGADDAFRSLAAGRLVPAENPQTIADGLRASLCPLTFQILRERNCRIVLVREEEIVAAMRLLWERLKLVVEPSGAVSAAPLLCHTLTTKVHSVGVILSGGNVDLARLPFA
ncbi:MAG: pyridoxal-phosphate dependent enzyme [Acidobacteriia bacterium]|jgi:threonine dehydratase|nr:pyridoxal-phosphate dependent enzyme [Terriglobia bacterium]